METNCWRIAARKIISKVIDVLLFQNAPTTMLKQIWHSLWNKCVWRTWFVLSVDTIIQFVDVECCLVRWFIIGVRCCGLIWKFIFHGRWMIGQFPCRWARQLVQFLVTAAEFTPVILVRSSMQMSGFIVLLFAELLRAINVLTHKMPNLLQIRSNYITTMNWRYWI